MFWARAKALATKIALCAPGTGSSATQFESERRRRLSTNHDEAALAAGEMAELAAALEESARLEEERRAPDEQASSSLAAERPLSVEEEEPPADFVCPITTEVMSDPVMAADGQSYERTAIERWLATKSTSPLTGEELEFTRLFPNHTLRRVIRQWQETARN
ncbi:hypothetical protein EMIHUDRAFT_209151 [Emiliania huxleyi CCMP1516]|uniref:U-box domain-containing protein n=2 Tax=Emiliania huxleyi TaxID=2903 RepID=A0A0D3J7S2_EMIH1|nr:hypothetical protein EMIHUDRAFT_209151 [Emiliania huxleyi CCMP1516]EOD19557.1 hypothetical protein EMIHUDRAFT_209151 [Emiliania huxleyi CCMP1516]|eukprot:XP_005771986.1 hypothetical protein EMIHUDRAFT_209151 [Emiliania huxleyi CCMP1516]